MRQVWIGEFYDSEGGRLFAGATTTQERIENNLLASIVPEECDGYWGIAEACIGGRFIKDRINIAVKFVDDYPHGDFWDATYFLYDLEKGHDVDFLRSPDGAQPS